MIDRVKKSMNRQMNGDPRNVFNVFFLFWNFTSFPRDYEKSFPHLLIITTLALRFMVAGSWFPTG